MTYAEFIQSLLFELERQRQYYQKTQKDVCADLEITQSQYTHMMNGTRKPSSGLIDKILTYLNCEIQMINHKQKNKHYNAVSNTEEPINFSIRYSIDPISVTRVENNQELHHDISFRDKIFNNLEEVIRHTESLMCDLPNHFGEINQMDIIPVPYYQYRFEITEGKKMESYLWLKEEVIPGVCEKMNIAPEKIGKVIYAGGIYFLIDKMRMDIYYAKPNNISLLEDVKFTIRYFLENANKQFTESKII